MKRTNNLFTQICEPENIRLGFYKAAKGKQNRNEIIQFRKDFEQNILNLHQQITTKTLDIGHYRFFTVRDPKQRYICAASFPERILHHAIMNVCEKVIDRPAIFDSYACRSGKGSVAALNRAQQFSRKYRWYLKLDIHKYFDSIDQRTLKDLLARYFKESSVLALFEQIIDSYHTLPGKGLPIGNLVSQHLANFYLSPLDHYLKETLGVRGYLRYLDDFVLMRDDKSSLKEDLKHIRYFLNERLHLTLHQNIQLNRSKHGMPFLGYRVSPGKIRLNSRSKNRFIHKFRQYEANFIKGLWSEQQLVNHMEPLIEFTRHANTTQFRQNVIHRFGVLS